jgi:hypothetical protein
MNSGNQRPRVKARAAPGTGGTADWALDSDQLAGAVPPIISMSMGMGMGMGMGPVTAATPKSRSYCLGKDPPRTDAVLPCGVATGAVPLSSMAPTTSAVHPCGMAPITGGVQAPNRVAVPPHSMSPSTGAQLGCWMAYPGAAPVGGMAPIPGAVSLCRMMAPITGAVPLGGMAPITGGVHPDRMAPITGAVPPGSMALITGAVPPCEGAVLLGGMASSTGASSSWMAPITGAVPLGGMAPSTRAVSLGSMAPVTPVKAAMAEPMGVAPVTPDKFKADENEAKPPPVSVPRIGLGRAFHVVAKSPPAVPKIIPNLFPGMPPAFHVVTKSPPAVPKIIPNPFPDMPPPVKLRQAPPFHKLFYAKTRTPPSSGEYGEL